MLKIEEAPWVPFEKERRKFKLKLSNQNTWNLCWGMFHAKWLLGLVTHQDFCQNLYVKDELVFRLSGVLSAIRVAKCMTFVIYHVLK